ncbi:hypothetical protein T03_6506 [Trichinella britovi]|uniref:Uncharacterized protein n=1 Tax=Trichinella britovi TaxID=45882 RepID=A0A0V1C4D6_TRIBR|nr:hypothetical protein T03_14297 [Trichinella britovi]KRY43721.1 hypothetical protein T03_6506 [Trichinella britovi]
MNDFGRKLLKMNDFGLKPEIDKNERFLLKSD